MRPSGKQTIAFPYFVPDKQQKQIASGSHRIADHTALALTRMGNAFIMMRWSDV
jgi:hypothetical protein